MVGNQEPGAGYNSGPTAGLESSKYKDLNASMVKAIDPTAG